MRVTKKRRLDLLGRVWLFEECSRRELNLLEGATTEMTFPAGKALTQQGELGRHFMVIVEGEVEVTRDSTQIAGIIPQDQSGIQGLKAISTGTIPTRTRATGTLLDTSSRWPSG